MEISDLSMYRGTFALPVRFNRKGGGVARFMTFTTTQGLRVFHQYNTREGVENWENMNEAERLDHAASLERLAQMLVDGGAIVALATDEEPRLPKGVRIST